MNPVFVRAQRANCMIWQASSCGDPDRGRARSGGSALETRAPRSSPCCSPGAPDPTAPNSAPAAVEEAGKAVRRAWPGAPFCFIIQDTSVDWPKHPLVLPLKWAPQRLKVIGKLAHLEEVPLVGKEGIHFHCVAFSNVCLQQG